MVVLSRKLHLGCGLVHKDGWLNVDGARLPGVDMVMDLERTPYDLPSAYFVEAELHHVCEHVNNFVGMMEELHRVMVPGGVVRVSVPYFCSPAFDLNPTHVRRFNWETFECFSDGWYITRARFRVVRRRLFFFSSRSFLRSRWYSVVLDGVLTRCAPLYQRFFCYVLPASELHVELLRV
jgi:SAM-dependent methyltransferase